MSAEGFRAVDEGYNDLIVFTKKPGVDCPAPGFFIEIV
jgi:hypothetical protein